MDEKKLRSTQSFFSFFRFFAPLSHFFHTETLPLLALLSLKFFVLLTEEKNFFSLLDISNFAQFNTFTFG